MTDPVMLDTDVVIDYLRNHPDAIAFVNSLPSAPMLSVITVAELYRGVRDGKERDELDQLVADSVVVALHLNSAAAGGLHQRQYGRSHGVGFADALIAALAQEQQVTLVTLNQKHYPMLPDVFVPYRKP
jgi:predicted nucleic acid-binding protein